MIISDLLNNILKKQTSGDMFLPKISQHITAELFHIKTGHIGFVIRLEGLPFESESETHLSSHFAQLARLLSGAGKTLGGRLGLWTTLQRRKKVFDREYAFDNPFCREFAAKYLAKFETGDYFENVFYLTGLIKYEDFEDGIKETQDLLSVLMQGLQPYDPVVLTAWQNQEGILFSEVFSFFGFLINGVQEDIPLSNVDAFQTLASSDLHFGTDVCEIRSQTGTRFAASFDLKDFGISKVKVLSGILDLPCEFTLTQSFVYVDSPTMQETIKKQLNNLRSVADQAIAQQDELKAGQGGLASGELMFGEYHSVLVVYGDTAKQASQNGAKVYTRFQNSGGYRFVKAGLSAPATYFSQVPGSKQKPRCFPKSTVNLATTFGMHNYSHGKSQGNPIGDGSAIMPLQTVSNTIYDFNFHFSNPKEDNVGDKIAGHTLILGATGTGKTPLETALLAFTDRFDPHLFVMDLDEGMKIFIRATGGTYYSLKDGQSTGCNPFQMPDSPKTREFLYKLVGICGKTAAGTVTAAEEKQIQLAVDTLMNTIEFANRNFSVLLQSIPHDPGNADSLRTRLSRWCRSEDGRYAWCLDNPSNDFDPDKFYRIGFDLTDILKDDYLPTEPVLAYLFYLRSRMTDRVAASGGILATVIEEFWYPARFEMTQDFMLKSLKTDRKLGGWVVLTSQSPEDAINSSIFAALVQQTPTKIFLPNPDAEFEGSYSRCGITQKEFEELVKLTLESRTFLIRQSRQSAFAKLNLYGFEDEIAVLSGSSDNVAIFDEVQDELRGAPIDVWYPVFKQRVSEARQIRRKKAA